MLTRLIAPLKDWWSSRKEQPLWGIWLLSGNPVILSLFDYHLFPPDRHLFRLFRSLPNVPIILMVKFSQDRSSEEAQTRIVGLLNGHCAKFPNHRIVLPTNTGEEAKLYSERGFETSWVNQNIFVDPRQFKPLPDQAKTFDAVYDARLNAFKRHALAAQIDKLAIITYFRPPLDQEDYARETRQLLKHATWCNALDSGGYRWSSAEEINGILNRSRVGLCLSATEGAMFASMQYLLAGLPVVSTPSRGGRDVFFDPDYVLIVQEDAQSVAAGVQELIRRQIPPEHIRSRTLLKLEVHQRRLIELVEKVTGAPAPSADWRKKWEQLYEQNRMSSTPREMKERISGC